MSKTREEKRRNRNWFLARLVVFIVGVALFFLIMVVIGSLADAAVALTWKGC